MRKALLLGLIVVSIKTVALVRAPFYKIQNGEGVWWERLEAEDGTLCRHKWNPTFDLTGKAVECAWAPDEYTWPKPQVEATPEPKKVRK